MSEKDIQRLIDLAKEKLKQSFNTPEEARQSLISAGIMEADGSLPAPLSELAQAS